MFLYNRRNVLCSILTMVGIFVYASHAWATNLVTNGDFSTGDSTGWTILQNGGSGATFGGGVYATSYDWAAISQTVDLVAAGYTTAQLDAAPSIVFNVDTMQRFDHDGYYYLEYKLLGADGTTVIDSKLYGSVGSPIYLSAGTDWFGTEYTFSGYGAGARYAYIKIAGQDGSPNWGGQYGPYFDNVSISFADSTNPSVLYLNPADDTTSVPVDSLFEIAFDEAIATSTGNIIIYLADDDSVVETIDITGSQVTASSTNALIIDPTNVLAGETEFYIMIDATAVNDLASNSFSGITASSTWSFTTAATPDCPTVANAASYNAYPTCGVARCNECYVELDGACVRAGGGIVVQTPVVLVPTDNLIDTSESTTDDFIDQNDAIGIDNDIDTTVFGENESQEPVVQRPAFVDGMLVKLPELPTVFLITTDQRRPFFNELAFISRGYEWGAIVMVDDLSWMPVGEMIYALETKQPKGLEQKEYFRQDLFYGMDSEAVRVLQLFLNKQGFVLAPSGPGAIGHETVYFRDRTQASVSRFQRANKIPVSGDFDALTRAVANRLQPSR